jgi:hypothetical protein
MLQESFDDDMGMLEAIKVGAVVKVREKMFGISSIESVRGIADELPVKSAGKNQDLKYDT